MVTKGNISEKSRQAYALKAFTLIAEYDAAILGWLRWTYSSRQPHLDLKYGVNPHHHRVTAYVTEGNLPFRALNTAAPPRSMIKILDALNGWQLVKELAQILNLPAAASFKHISPSGVAVSAIPLTSTELKAYRVEDIDGIQSSMLAQSLIRARGVDVYTTIQVQH